MKYAKPILALASMMLLASCGGMFPGLSIPSTPSSEAASSQAGTSSAEATSEAGTSEATSQATSEATSQGTSEQSSQASQESSQQSSESKPVSGKVWQAVTNVNDLSAGDRVIFGESGNGYVSGDLSTGTKSKYLNAVQASYDEEIEGFQILPKSAVPYTLGKSGSDWTFSNGSGKLLGATDAKTLTLGEKGAENTWSITITKKGTTVASADAEFGSIQFNYNRGNPRFLNYTSSQTPIQLYKETSLEPVYATSIAVSGASEVSEGRKTDLSVTFTPSDTNVKDLQWTSLNPEIATVDSTGKVTGVAQGSATIQAAAKDETGAYSVTATHQITVTEFKPDAWTILMYVCGSDLESQNGLATADIDEILSVTGQPDNVNIVLQTGGAASWESKYGIPNKSLVRWHVRNRELVKDMTLDDASMGDPDTLESFLTWGLEEYPAEKTGLILWNHGGAMDGVCFDENHTDKKGYSDSLLSSEVHSAVDAALDAAGIDGKLEFIGYDACLMQEQDIAITNADQFNYMVAAQEAEVGEGWAYSGWVDDLYQGDGTEIILTEICDSFVASVEKDYPGDDNDQTISYLDLSKADAYKTAFENVAEQLSATGNGDKVIALAKDIKGFGDEWCDYSDYQAYLEEGWPEEYFVQKKDSGETYYVFLGAYYYGTLDAKDFMDKIHAEAAFASVDLSAWQAAFDDFVAYSKIGGGAGNAHGLSLVLPASVDVAYEASETPLTKWHAYCSTLPAIGGEEE